MPKLAEPNVYNIELTQEEVNHITVALGRTENNELKETSYSYHGRMKIADNDVMYKFFRSLSESKLNY